MALITPALSHPEVVVAAVAARDPERARKYARRHGIPEVKPTYEALIADPTIDCVYIPLPNGLHFEWAIRALRAGKHVLLEKPSTSNAHDAERLFAAAAAAESAAPVVCLEAFHYRFQPSWAGFLAHIDQPHIARVRVQVVLPSGLMPPTDIRFNYELGGGALLDLGVYAINVARTVCGADPVTCDAAAFATMPPPRDHADHGFHLTMRMAGSPGAIADLRGDLRGGSLFSLVVPQVEVTHRPVVVAVADVASAVRRRAPPLQDGELLVRIRTVRLYNFLISTIYHRIELEDRYEVRRDDDDDDDLVAQRRHSWTERRQSVHKAYTWRDVQQLAAEGPDPAPPGPPGAGEAWWTSYRHQLEQFVHRVKGRPTSCWVDGADSVATMRAVDMAYAAGGLPLRPESEYQ